MEGLAYFIVSAYIFMSYTNSSVLFRLCLGVAKITILHAKAVSPLA